jgi:outer membrane receptor protein involved in Fe transport
VVQDNVALFAQDQTRWSSSLVTQIGARIDNNSDYGDSFSPYLGLKYRFTPKTNMSLTYSEAFLAPSPSFSYEHFGSFSGQQDSQGRYTASTFRIPNPDLQPETARALEAVVNYNPTSQLRWTATAYTSRLDNLILYSADTLVPVSDFIDGGFLKKTKQRVNLGSSFASGIELSSRYRKNSQRYNIDFWGAYSFTEGTLESDKADEGLPYTARHKLKLGSTVRWPKGLFISPTLYLMDKSRVPSSAAKGGRSLVSPAYGLLNLYAGYEQIVAGVNAFLRVENVTSRRYYNAGGTSDISIVQLPQLRRSVTLGVEVEF